MSPSAKTHYATQLGIKMVKLLWITAFSALWYISAHAETSSPPGKDKSATVLINLEMKANVGENIGPGGFDAQILGATWLPGRPRYCGPQIREIGHSWAKDHGLSIMKEEMEGGRVAMEIGEKNPKGLFQLVYRYSKSRELSTIRFEFYATDGSSHPPELSFPGLDIDALSDKLQDAMVCTRN